MGLEGVTRSLLWGLCIYYMEPLGQHGLADWALPASIHLATVLSGMGAIKPHSENPNSPNSPSSPK